MKHKRVLVLIAFIAITLYGSAQLTVREVAAPAEDISLYDSLSDKIMYDGYKRYIGQQILVLPKSKKYFSYSPGYRDFCEEPKRSACNSGNAGRFPELAGTYLKIVDILDKTNKDDPSANVGFYLKLQSKDGSILYYQVATNARNVNGALTPFMFTGYLEKLKQLNLNKKFIALNKLETARDVNTGKAVEVLEGSEWTCVELTFVEAMSDPEVSAVYIFKDSLANEIAIGIKGFYEGLSGGIQHFRSKQEIVAEQQQKRAEEIKRLADEKKALAQQTAQNKQATAAAAQAKKERRENLIKKYGDRYGNMIADGKVEIGMNAQMCTDAWGKPRDINRTTGAYGTHEQWVYNLKSYLYFENGKLITIQN